jgi:thioredoxin reductase (NADPH)
MNSSPPESADVAIVGGGPAGLTAAIYLARSLRSVVLFDCPVPGRADWAQTNHNFFGFPRGIKIQDLADRGRRQAERYGARIVDREVTAIKREGHCFEVRADKIALSSRSVILATGVIDRWVEFPGYQRYIGRSMHWCIVCDGYEMRGKRVVIAGDDAEAAEIALQMLRYAGSVTLLAGRRTPAITPKLRRDLEANGITFMRGRVVSARERKPGMLRSVALDSGEEIELDHLFSAFGAAPRSALARSLGAKLAVNGHIKVDTETRTSVPGLFAAGDVTRLFSHQVLTAAHEGATAAMAAEHDLFERDKQE